MTRRRSVKIGGGMPYRRLGRTGLMASEVGFGAWAVGGVGWGPVDDEVSIAAIRRALDLGVNFFDTADIYGLGHSERLLARALERRRPHALIATKGGLRWENGRVHRVYDPAYIVEAVERSRERLDTEWIDLYQLHNPTARDLQDPALWEALGRLKADGIIRHIGVSAPSPEDGIAAIETGHVDTVQVAYNLLDPRAGHVLLPLAQERNVGVIAHVPLASGFLTGKYAPDHEFPEGDNRRSWPRERLQETVDRVERLRFLSADGGPTMAQAALAWVLSHPAVATTIPGGKTPAQVEENAAAAEHAPLPGEVLARVREEQARRHR